MKRRILYTIVLATTFVLPAFAAEKGFFEQNLWIFVVLILSFISFAIKMNKSDKSGRKVAEEGNAYDQYNYAVYLRDSAIDKNKGLIISGKRFKEAIEWFRKSGEQGNLDSQIFVAMRLLKGESVTQDEAEANKWFRLAAEQGNYFAQEQLGISLLQGRGIANNRQEAVEWFQKSALQGDSSSEYYLNVISLLNSGVIRQEKDAPEWYYQQSLADNREAQYFRSIAIIDGICTEKYKNEIVNLMQESANAGFAPAQYMIGYYLRTGERGFKQDKNAGEEWYRKAAEQGLTYAQYEMALIKDTEESLPESVEWYRKAAEHGHANAQNNLGVAYANGSGVIQDDYEAVKWYRLAAESGNAYAQRNIAYMLLEGKGVEKNLEDARFWFNKASIQGKKPSDEALKKLSVSV